MSGGKKANESGNAWEAWVKVVANKHNFQILPFKERKNKLPLSEKDRYVWLRAPYKTVYNTEKEPKANSEFVFETLTEKIRVECKWQNDAGSVDEKYLFMYLNGILTVEEPTIIFALGGSHFFDSERGKTIRLWLEAVCSKPPEWLSPSAIDRWRSKELIVLNNNTFERWFRERFS